jgi:hypothetical protein
MAGRAFLFFFFKELAAEFSSMFWHHKESHKIVSVLYKLIIFLNYFFSLILTKFIYNLNRDMDFYLTSSLPKLKLLFTNSYA